MTKDEFLANPIVAAATEGASIPPEWFASAWHQQEFREYILDLAVRSVEKTGSLGLAVEWLELMPAALSGTHVRELYTAIKERTERSETEWREEFESLFAAHRAALPPVDLQRVIDNAVHELIFYIGLRRVTNVRAVVDEIVANKWDLAHIRMKTSGLRAIPEGNRLLQQLSLQQEEVVTPLQIATLLGDRAIIELLTQARIP